VRCEQRANLLLEELKLFGREIVVGAKPLSTRQRGGDRQMKRDKPWEAHRSSITG
jgi:hypothetical protein